MDPSPGVGGWSAKTRDLRRNPGFSRDLSPMHSHSGSGIEAALAEEVGTRFAVEKLRGNDFWVGAIGAATLLHTDIEKEI